MAGCVEGLIDAQGASISFREEGATSWEVTAEVTDLPMPDSTRPVDDVTTVDSKFKKKATAGAIDNGALALEFYRSVVQISKQNFVITTIKASALSGKSN
ncbi:hypothetical protein OHW85_21375 [Acinetobacter baumannii]|nr:hypothetical protein [Acinetobacter baumannii]